MRRKSEYMLAYEVPEAFREKFNALVAKHRHTRLVSLRDAQLAVGAQVIAAGLGALTK